jgi:hypothetical protein
MDATPGLIPGWFVTILPVMVRLARQLLVLVLAAYLSAGPGWSATQATGIPEKMTVAMDSADGSCGGCLQCPMTGDVHAKAFLCGTMCGIATQAVAPQFAPAVLTNARLIFAALEQPPRGRTSPPDPYPPKLSRAV